MGGTPLITNNNNILVVFRELRHSWYQNSSWPKFDLHIPSTHPAKGMFYLGVWSGADADEDELVVGW